MESDTNIGKRLSSISDADLLRAIGNDLRSIYAEIIKQPLPRNIEAALSRIEREQTRIEYQSRRAAY
jgi:hypothetical protein